MKSTVESVIAIKNGMEKEAAVLEEMRVKRIRESDILIDGPALDEAFKSARFLGIRKSTSGLVSLRELLTRMGR